MDKKEIITNNNIIDIMNESVNDTYNKHGNVMKLFLKNEILEILDCEVSNTESEYDGKFTMEDIDKIVNELLDEDEMFDEIDNYIISELDWYLKNKEGDNI